MHLLYCEDPFDRKVVDPDYADEFGAAKSNGFDVHLFSFETLVKDKDVLAATKKIKQNDTVQKILYRGWMLKPKDYALLYEALREKNYQLINSPMHYKNCHYLPESYKFIEGHTPKTAWISFEEKEPDFDAIERLIEPFGNRPLIVKDFVKSQKHYWNTACFIPSASDKAKLRSVIRKFMELQGEDLNEGLVLREFIELNDLAVHSKSGMPLKQEYRIFFYNQKLLACFDYWEEGVYSPDEKPPLHLFQNIAENVDSNFFTMDIAKTKNGDWIIIELGDGQVAALPDKADRNEFYQLLHASLESNLLH